MGGGGGLRIIVHPVLQNYIGIVCHDIGGVISQNFQIILCVPVRRLFNSFLRQALLVATFVVC